MKNDIIIDFYNTIINIIQSLEVHKELSLAIAARNSFSKEFILASASYFEDRIKKILLQFITQTTNNNNYILSYVKNKAIALQYHTYFNWGEHNQPDKSGNNANKFFSLFGNDFKKEVQEIIRQDSSIDESIKSFLEIGHLRNYIIHSNFATQNYQPKTLEELKDLYVSANDFLIFLDDLFLHDKYKILVTDK